MAVKRRNTELDNALMAGKGLVHGAQGGRADATPLAAHQRHTTGAATVV